MKNRTDSDYCTVRSGEACERLGISRDTLYAYVSRGLVRTIAQPGDARKSLYDRRDIEALLVRKSRGRSRRSVAESTINWGEPVLISKITRIADGQFYYRGNNAVEMSRSRTLEDILHTLAGVRSKSPARSKRVFPLQDGLSPFNRILEMMARQAIEHRAGDGRPRAGEIMRLTALSAAGCDRCLNVPVHALLAKEWSDDPGAADLLRRALVLCADHELNASTYAARVAASAGASLPAALLAGLSTLSGTGHGGITTRFLDWMDGFASGKTLSLQPGDAPPPGFGHPLYPDGDPRARELLRHCPMPAAWRDAMRQVNDATGARPSLDFALALLERHLRLPQGAALGIFAVGRTAGWIAHIFEQRRTGRLIRPRAAVDG
ncbi:citrate/2-methylcitrate synthase [Hoeflea sp. TYP-13]|uniref:citrate/2-methylcitrate synthase n=1 Tax=Hoeflea sp. TYP-13 TaxID=3230023 RepID=UPI0034C63C2B